MSATATKPDAFDRVEQIKQRIRLLEDEAQAIVDRASEEAREPSGSESDRLTEIMGADRSGDDPNCEMAQAFAALKEWEQIAEGITRRQQARKEAIVPTVTPALKDEVAQLVPHREFPMGGTQAVRVPATATRYSSRLAEFGNAWGRTPQQREENAYAAGMWIVAHLFPQHPETAQCRLIPKAKQFCEERHILAQQSGGDMGKGGYLVPTPLEQTIIEIREMYGALRRGGARMYPMSAKTLDLPKFSAGLQVGLTAEAAEFTLTEKQWVRPTLTAKKAAGYAQWSNEVDEDAIISMAADLSRDFGIAFALREDHTGFMGDGVADFANMGITGIVNALLAGATLQLSAGNTGVNDIAMTDYEALLGKIINMVTPNLRWYMHKSTYYASVSPLKTGAGGNTIATLTDGDPLPAGADFRFLGVPGIWTNVLPDSTAAAGTKGVVILGDLSLGVAFGEARGITVQTSEHVEFKTDQMVMRGSSRFDIITHATGDADKAEVIAQIQLAAA